jgi:hypothetical protein
MHSAVADRALRICFAGLLGASLSLPATAADHALRKLRIDSNPPGAEVELIGGSAGHTPLSVDERAIYPNDYSRDRAQLYGTVTLRRAGCEPLVHRVTRGDFEHGLQLTLDCASQAVAPTTEAERPPTPYAPVAPALSSATATESSARRLRQLQVLQELLDDGLLTAAEEQRIRRKLLEMP